MVLSKDLKKAIAFGVIVGCIFQILTVVGFCVESEDVTVSVVDNVGFTATSETFISTSYNCAYFQVEPGYSYTITNTTTTSNPRLIAFSNTVPTVGEDCFYVTTINSGDSYTFNSSQFGYIYCDIYNTGGFEVTRVDLNGLDSFVDVLIDSINTQGLWNTFLDCVPLIALFTLFGLGVFFIVRLVVGIVKARGGF